RNIELRHRLQPICIRTLRKQVIEYIPFTRRIPITQDFLPSDPEHQLYETISSYLQREILIALPASQRALITLVLRKLLASSTFAIANTLERLLFRLESMYSNLENFPDDSDIEGIEELQDELEESKENEEIDEKIVNSMKVLNVEDLKAEIADLRQFIAQAKSISSNAKGEALIPALKSAFNKAQELGAQKKAVIFTESRRTQQYLFELLSHNGYEGKLAMMNGINNDPQSKSIYEAWCDQQKSQNNLLGSRPIDIKTAIVEHFRDVATILIATEAAAEGINLQFCSLVVNYDLPWNPQRIEQRIGRCHRYGQKHDVVVVNFLNQRNEADRRVFEILSEKFSLFDGVFGASDEVLGVLESGIDIERRIAKVYQTCRNTEEIKIAFDQLQSELDEQIQSRMEQTRRTLIENFDEDVSARLRVHRDKTMASLNERERWLLDITRTELDGEAKFESDRPRFYYTGTNAKQGWYHFDWKEAEKNGDIFYRQDHPFAESLIQKALSRELAPALVHLNYTNHGQVISILKPYVGSMGWLELSKLKVHSLDSEEFLIFSAQTDNGQILDDEICRKLMILPAAVSGDTSSSFLDFSQIRNNEVNIRLKQVEKRNSQFFDEEIIKLDHWSDDLKQGLEHEIKELDQQIRENRKTSALAATLKDKLEAQKSMKSLETERNKRRRDLFDAQDAIDEQRDELIHKIEGQLHQTHNIQTLFRFQWELL
ncbi:MAG: helicase-related protein, partial [Planctomycetota bacterium]